MDKMQGIDADGFILRLPSEHLQPEFKSVVDDVCYSLGYILGDVVHSIYLYGSVAAGTAKPGESDLDVTLLLNGQSEFYATQIDLIKDELLTRHPEIIKIDFDVGSVVEALAPETF